MSRSVLLAFAVPALLLLVGCGRDSAYVSAAPPPPPPPMVYAGQTPPLVQLAERNGYRAGYDEGGRDAYYRAGYQPRNNRTYADAPGYDYRLGPIPPYVDAFRAAYLRGYDVGFYRRDR